MNIFFADQTSKFPELLDRLKKLPLNINDKTKLPEKVSIIGINISKPISEIDLRFLFDYNIFPKKIMSHLTQWQFEQRNMRIGDTILQQIYLPPLGKFSQKIIFGVRVNEIINESNRKGFSYETLQGHIEKGISIFTVEETLKSEIICKIQTFSKPGNIVTQIISPLISTPYQAYCTKQALTNLKKQLEKN